MERRLTELRQCLRGWIGDFGLAPKFDDIVVLDGFPIVWLRGLPSADVLLETVALPPDEDPHADKAWGYSQDGDQARHQSQEVLADVSDTRHALRDAKQMAGRTRTLFVKRALERACSSSGNRAVLV
jgi:hypothetical protein